MAFCLVVFLSESAVFGSTTLKFGLFSSPDHPWSEGILKLKENVEQASQGAIKIEIVPIEALGSSQDFLDQLEAGSIDIGIFSTYYLRDVVEAMRIFTLPFAFRDRVQAKIFTSGVLAEKLLGELDDHGLVGLEFIPSENSVIINTSKPIAEPEDFRGLKVATLPDPTVMEAFQALGAGPVSIPWADVPMAMARGALSTAEGPASFFFKSKSYEVAKYMTMLPVNYFPGIIAASPRTWTKIPSDQRELLSKLISQAIDEIDEKMDSRIASTIENMKERGVNVSYPRDLSPFRKAVVGVYKSAAGKIPAPYWQVAYNCAYVKRDLEVNSRPGDATVLYRRDGDKSYETYHELTNTSIELEYAVWQIRVELAKYIPQEKNFNPYTSKKWIVDFNLQKK